MFETQILVNGNRCKQYNFQGRCYIESKHGSEYELEIKNNYYKRILAVCSVDGLDVLTGKPADPDAGGYIIDAYHPIRIKGFRVNDDEVGAFKFTCKGASYATSKQDGSERNVGVIGIRLYYEVEPVVTYTIRSIDWNLNAPKYDPYNPFTTTCRPIPNYTMSSSYSCCNNYQSDVQYGCSVTPASLTIDDSPKIDFCCDSDTVFARGMSSGVTAKNLSPQPKGFDMGTEFGKKKESKVQLIDFKKGYLALSLDIYYASRESLIEMGVPITNELKINFPESFSNKYCTPPKNWNG